MLHCLIVPGRHGAGHLSPDFRISTRMFGKSMTNDSTDLVSFLCGTKNCSYLAKGRYPLCRISLLGP